MSVVTYRQLHEDPTIYVVEYTLQHVGLSGTNCVVIISDGQALVVDPGVPTSAVVRDMRATLRRLIPEDCAVTYCATHLHTDHSAAIPLLAAPDAPVILSRKDCERCDRMRAGLAADYEMHARRQGLSPTAARALLVLDEAKRGSASIVERATRVSGGDEVRVGDVRLQVIDTPGHTVGHLSLYEPQTRTLIGGDHVLFATTPVLALAPDAPTSSIDEYLRSLDAVDALDVRAFVPGHGTQGAAGFNLRERTAWLRRHHAERLERVLATVRATPCLTGLEITKRVSLGAGARSWRSLHSVIRLYLMEQGFALLDHAVRHNMVERELDDCAMWRYRAS